MEGATVPAHYLLMNIAAGLPPKIFAGETSNYSKFSLI